MSVWLYLLQQAACAWSLLLALGLLFGLRRPRPLRMSLTAVACGLAALICAMAGRSWLAPALLLLITALAPMAAWPGIPRSRRWSAMLGSLLLTLLMAGCGRMLHAAGLSRPLLIPALLPLLPVLMRLLPRTAPASCATVEITRDPHRISLTALVDSGNLLRDPLTRLPVIVISRQAASRLMDAGAFSPGMRLISVRTVAGSSLMPVFRPTQVRLLLPGGWQEVQAVIGLSPEGYSGYQALVPASILSSPQGGISLCL